MTTRVATVYQWEVAEEVGIMANLIQRSERSCHPLGIVGPRRYGWWLGALVVCLGGMATEAMAQRRIPTRGQHAASARVRAGVTRDQKISAAQLQRLVEGYFKQKPGYQTGDLISQGDFDAILKLLVRGGWQPSDAAKIRQAMLPDGDFLVQLMSTRNGQKFMRRVKREKLIYDRLDRIARVPQGKQMLSDLVKLPDSHRYAASRRPRGVPSLLDLLPKRGTSRTRAIKDYDKPTGRIYTEAQLLARLEQSLRDSK